MKRLRAHTHIHARTCTNINNTCMCSHNTGWGLLLSAGCVFPHAELLNVPQLTRKSALLYGQLPHPDEMFSKAVYAFRCKRVVLL